MTPVNLLEFEALARDRMDRGAFDYFNGGAGDEQTMAANRQAFADLALRPRVLVDVETVDTSTTLFGQRTACPVLLAPAALQQFGHPDGELATARAAGAAGAIMCCSTISTFSIEDVAAAATGPLWFQLYVFRDREVSRDLVRRAEAAGCTALILTVDTPRLGNRDRDARNGFAVPPHIRLANLEPYARAAMAQPGGPRTLPEWVHRLYDPSLTWDAITWLRSISHLPLLVKGILTAEDAVLAVQHGASGVIVSNHGGRQLDGAIATVAALPEIVGAVNGAVPVLVDGGVRRGTDVVKALALGASAVLMARPYLWGLAADGEAGVRRVLAILAAEVELAMALLGCQSVDQITRAQVRSRG